MTYVVHTIRIQVFHVLFLFPSLFLSLSLSLYVHTIYLHVYIYIYVHLFVNDDFEIIYIYIKVFKILISMPCHLVAGPHLRSWLQRCLIHTAAAVADLGFLYDPLECGKDPPACIIMCHSETPNTTSDAASNSGTLNIRSQQAMFGVTDRCHTQTS